MGFGAHPGWEKRQWEGALGDGAGRATGGRCGEEESHGLAPGPSSGGTI